MTAAWMVYGLLVGVVLAASAWGLDAACRLARRPVRAVWLVAMLATVVLVGVAPLRRESGVVVTTALVGGVPAPGAAPARRNVLASIRRLAEAGAGEVRQGLAEVTHRVPTRLDLALGILWAFGSGAAALAFLVVQLRFQREKRRWLPAELDGICVRIAPTAGPAAIGIVRPEIVVPRWLLALPSEQRRAALLHEAEHLRAGDPVLLSAGWLAVILVPWNLAVWWMLSRLRLAAELDCDARLLNAGVEPRSYGTLLIDIAGRGSSLALSAAALADSHSHLRKRLDAMIPRTRRFAAARLLTLGAIALGGTFAACEAALPTDAEIEKMDAASAEHASRAAGLIAQDGSEVVYLIDGKTTTAEQAHALSPERISSITVTKNGSPAKQSVVAILTKTGDIPAASTASTDRGEILRARLEEMSAKASDEVASQGHTSADPRTVEPGRLRASPHILERQQFTGLIFIDGAVSTPQDLHSLDRDRIDRIEVLKGGAARRLYRDPAAANGVIEVTTRNH